MKYSMTEQTFHRAFGKAKDVEELKYKWIGWRTLNTALLLLLNGLEFVTVMYLVYKEGINFDTAGTLSLFVVCLMEQMYFWRLATKWPFIMRTWRKSEDCFLRVPYKLFETFNMKRRIYVLSSFIMLGALTEHSVLMYHTVDKLHLERSMCESKHSFGEDLYRTVRYHLSLVLPYKLWLMPFLEWTNLTLAYVRSFTDAFIICLSVGLAMRFQELQLRIENAKLKHMPEVFWGETRSQYLSLKRLLHYVNDEISPLILLAFGNNMFFICFQLFNSFRNFGVNFIAMSVFWFSLLFAILRTALTIFMASTIEVAAKRMVGTLRDVPSRFWCLELERFSAQLSFDTTAFTGNGFFLLTRQLILAMASTVVTYELLVTDVIKKGPTNQKIDNCSKF